MFCLSLSHHHHHAPCTNKRHKLGEERRLHLELSRAINRHYKRLPPHPPTAPVTSPRPMVQTRTLEQQIIFWKEKLTSIPVEHYRDHFEEAHAQNIQERRVGHFTVHTAGG
jgi:hypothetical protein